MLFADVAEMDHDGSRKKGKRPQVRGRKANGYGEATAEIAVLAISTIMMGYLHEKAAFIAWRPVWRNSILLPLSMAEGSVKMRKDQEGARARTIRERLSVVR